MASTSVQSTPVSAEKRKNVGAVGELATESQRSKLKQHHQQKKRQQKQAPKNQNNRQVNDEYQRAAEFHNQGISVDLGILFGSADIINNEGVTNKQTLNQKENILVNVRIIF